MKKMTSALFAILLVLGCVFVPVHAQEAPDTGRTGSITIHMDWEGEHLGSGSLTLYRVGRIAQIDGKYVFVPVEQLQSIGISLENLEDPALAEKLASLAVECRLQAITAPIAEGKAEFGELELGLYVVTQKAEEASEGFAPIRPFLLSVPQWRDGGYVYELTADPKVPLETEPAEPSEPAEPTEPSEPNLPQTGQTNWPIPVLAVLGLLFLVIGGFLRFGKREADA